LPLRTDTDIHCLYPQRPFRQLPPLVCQGICQKLYVITQASYSAGGKYCSRCAHCFITPKVKCECCGMLLRTSPMAKAGKERARARRREEKRREERRKLITAVLCRSEEG